MSSSDILKVLSRALLPIKDVYKRQVMIRVGIAGAAGYTAGELIRVLISHPQVELRYLQSESHRGEPVGRVHRDLIYMNLKFSDLDLTDIDVLFLCMGHGMSAQFLERHPVPALSLIHILC